MSEIWKDVIGYEGLYKVSNMGRIKSCIRIKERLMKIDKTDKYGYIVIHLYKNGKMKNLFAHRLVLEAFVGICPKDMQCCHYDGIKTNNKLDNLRWGTQIDNVKDSRRQGKLVRTEEFKIKMSKSMTGSNNPMFGIHINCKKVRQYSKNGKFIAEYESAHEAQRQTGINYTNIRACCAHKGYYKSAGGFVWKEAV